MDRAVDFVDATGDLVTLIGVAVFVAAGTVAGVKSALRGDGWLRSLWNAIRMVVANIF